MMRKQKKSADRSPTRLLAIAVLSAAVCCPIGATAADDLAEQLKSVPYKICYETYQSDNWELFVCNADGSKPTNLTKTPDVNELYPHVSPDGKKICFSVDEGDGPSKVRNVYAMDFDGTGRKLVAANARQAFWKPDSVAIAYLKGEFEKFSYLDYATKGIFVYDLKTAQHRQHQRNDVHHLYNPCYSPDGKWILSTVHAGMGHKHAILAIEADGSRVVDLNIPGCRPDVSPDGRRVAWGPSDWALRVGELDFSGSEPKVINPRDVVTSEKPMKVYHVDWSPDGKYIAYSRGPAEKRLGLVSEIVGVKAEGWNIWVADPATPNRAVQITTDGKCNKEPDWVYVPKK
ncbi:MAG: PD40 domain-containing protein [Candidatus Nealsonbacteria bacterium]|nr:PD40 domain-containing protein [Candidatus Nealsonbacteria bacterium]